MSDRNWEARSQISGVGTTGTSAALNGDIIDFASNGGFHSAMGIGVQSASVTIGTGPGPLLLFQEGTASGSLSDATGDVLGAKTTLYLNVDHPPKRFGRFVFRNGTATGAFRTLVTQVYEARKVPTTHPASTTGTAIYTPGTGTATG